LRSDGMRTDTFARCAAASGLCSVQAFRRMWRTPKRVNGSPRAFTNNRKSGCLSTPRPLTCSSRIVAFLGSVASPRRFRCCRSPGGIQGLMVPACGFPTRTGNPNDPCCGPSNALHTMRRAPHHGVKWLLIGIGPPVSDVVDLVEHVISLRPLPCFGIVLLSIGRNRVLSYS
jgi:hypothetical protein